MFLSPSRRRPSPTCRGQSHRPLCSRPPKLKVGSILFHNTQLLALIVIKIWENLSSALEEVQTVIDSRSKHEFLAKKGLGRVGRSTFFLGADQRLSGEGVFNDIYYCPLGFRAPCTCIPLCTRLGILMFWLRASIFSVVNRETNFLSNGAPLAHASRFVA